MRGHAERLCAILWVGGLLLSGAVVTAFAQVAPPPPPIVPLVAPVDPPGNPTTVSKALLGKALFWDEQLSATRSVACATCHIPSAGGSDPRSFSDPVFSTHPGSDELFGTDDDVVGSPGVPRSLASGAYDPADHFGIGVQATGRKSPSMINAAYVPELFWDGRAGGVFFDPESGAQVLPAGGALESQAAGPPLSDVEMSSVGADWASVVERIGSSTPLALASDLPSDLGAFVEGKTYAELFEEVFGSPQISAASAVMAIAAYERTLFSDQTPFNALLAGQPALTAQEIRGRNVFTASGCNACHSGNRLTDDRFHYIGLRPAAEDLGRFAVTGNNPDRGAFRTPSLLNVELRAPYFHNGRFETLEEVVAFYNRGGDFNAPNKSPLVRPLGLGPQQQADLVAFLRRPLTDPRVEQELAPFDRPTLFSESDRLPIETEPQQSVVCVAVEPGLVGNPSFTVGVSSETHFVGSVAVLTIGYEPQGGSIDAMSAVFSATRTLSVSDTGAQASASWAIPRSPQLPGRTLHGRWYFETASGFEAGPAFSFPAFGDASCAADFSTTNTNPGDTGFGVPDGTVNGSDLSVFVESWLQLSSLTDLTTTSTNPGAPGYGLADGRMDGADLSFYVEAWLAGCP